MRIRHGGLRLGAAQAITMALAAVLLSGMLAAAAPAATKTGTGKAETLNGTARADVLLGVGGNDKVFGRGGADELLGGPGNDKVSGGPGVDTLLGGPGNDTLNARDGAADTVNCGTGNDSATVDQIDEVSNNCERVIGQVAATPPTPQVPNETPKTPEEPKVDPEPEEPGYDGTLEETPISNVKQSAGWTGVGGTFSDQAGGPFEINGKSFRIETDGVGGEAIATSPALEPINLKKSHITFHSRLEFASRLDKVKVRLASEDDFGNNYAEAIVWQSDFDPIIQQSTFEFQSIPRASFTVVGKVDWKAIDRAQIVVTDTGAGLLRLYVAGLYGVKTSEIPTLSFAFDDGRISTYTKGLAALSQHRFPATAYVIADTIGTGGLVSLEQLRTLQKQHHWEIGGHAMHVASHNLASGLDTLGQEDPAALKAEFDDLKAWMTENAFPLRTFAYPKGAAKQYVRDYVTRDYCAGRATAEGPETIPPRDPNTLRGWSINSAETATTVNAKIDAGVAAGAWTMLSFHDIVDGAPAPGTNEFNTTAFNEVVAHVRQLQKEGKVRVKTVADALGC